MTRQNIYTSQDKTVFRLTDYTLMVTICGGLRSQILQGVNIKSRYRKPKIKN